MLIWIVALHCEAKPVIDFYRLAKSPAHRGFDLYQNDDMCCVVSGIGKSSAAAATAWVAALQRHQTSIAWINLGVAGAASHDVGSTFWINKIICDSIRKHYFPVPTFTTGFSVSACTTLDKASNEYQLDTLFDMEASGFFSTATRFSSAELIHCLKIVSDNQNQQLGFDKAAISALINQHIDPIDNFVQQLLALNQQCMSLQISDAVWRPMLDQAKFSATQQVQLRNILGFLLARKFDIATLQQKLDGCSSSREMLKQLNQIRIEESRNL